MSGFTIGLAILGALVLAALVAWNAWTTRRSLPRQPEVPTTVAEEMATRPERTEPVLDDAPLAPIPPPERRPGLDALIDAIAQVAVDAPVSGEAALAALPPTRRAGSKPFAVEGRNEATGEWETPRAGQRYGVGHLVDVLLGKDNEKVRNFGHEKLSVFGVGKGLAEVEWRSLFRQLVARGLVDIDLEGYGGLRLSDSCRPLLRGEVTLQLRRDLKPQTTAKASSSSGGSPASQLVRAEERELWEALRTLRRKLAEEHSVPPYVIFPDSTLLEMLRSQPVSLSDMAQVSGVGARKLERYGQAFLEVLNNSGGTEEAPKVVLDLRHELVSLARAGMTPAQIAGQLNCSEKNVYSLLAEALGRQELSLEQAIDLPEDLMMEVQDAFLDGEGELPPVSAIAPQFGARVPEGVLYCVRAALAAEFEL